MGPKTTTVAVVRCASYDRAAIQEAVNNALTLTGGAQRFIRPGCRVLIKPNLIVPVGPDIPAQTHPEVIYAVAEWIKQAGAIPLVGDSPAWGSVRACLSALGVDRRLESLGAQIVPLNRPVRMTIEGVSVGVSRAALEADAIINLPKLKAHQQLGATFAFKNMYGCVPGKEKAYWHFAKGRCYTSFCRILVGLHQTLSPAVNLIDGVVAMEGQGPIRGTARSLGVLVAGTDAAACEHICCRLIGFDPATLPILQTARAMHVGCHDQSAIRCVGDPWTSPLCPDFKPAEQTPLRFSFKQIFKSILRQAVLLGKERLRTQRDHANTAK